MNGKIVLMVSVLIVLSCLVINTLYADEVKQSIKTLEAFYTKTPPKLDGVLDDSAWKNGPNVDDIFITYNPVDGDILPQKTNVYLAYDHDNLYVPVLNVTRIIRIAR